MIKKVKSYWNESWVQLEEFPTKTKHYFFSNYGRVKSVDKADESERLLKPAVMGKKYNVFLVKYQNGLSKTYFMQKLVAEAFCDRESADYEFVVHIDGNTQNDHFLNLKWLTRDGLTEHFRDNDIWNPVKKKRNPAYKMNPTRVKLLKKRLQEGKTKKSILAKNFNITIEQVRKIEKGIDWAWVEIPAENPEEKTPEKAMEKTMEKNSKKTLEKKVDKKTGKNLWVDPSTPFIDPKK